MSDVFKKTIFSDGNECVIETLLIKSPINNCFSDCSSASSTNHCLKIVSANCSKVLFWRCSKSILSSRLHKMEAIDCCSERGGRIIDKFEISSGRIEGYAEVDASAII